jgi:hypothetical protein
MTGLFTRLAVFAVPIIAVGLAMPAEAQAQACKSRIVASGTARPTDSWARRTANSMWKRQVIAEFGEQYGELSAAKDVDYRCAGGSLGRRCTVEATPCRVGETTSSGQVIVPPKKYRCFHRDGKRICREI